MPSRPPDVVCDLATSARAALIYRLSGDWNPLHISPEVAREAGHARPILHGLATFGGRTRAARALRQRLARLRAMHVRFSAPVYPGDTIRTEMWKEQNTISFRSSAVERNVVVLNNGAQKSPTRAAQADEQPRMTRTTTWSFFYVR
jgi:acyl dehydratase